VQLTITASYLGDAKSEELETGTAQLKIRGEVFSAFPVSTQELLRVTYNQQLDSSCLRFDKKQVEISILDESQPFGPLYDGMQANPNASYYGHSGYLPQEKVYNNSGYNPYGYDSSGRYQTSSSKSASVNVENNCGVELNLIPTIENAQGEATIEGLKIAAVDSSLKIRDGETKAVDVRVTNGMVRRNFYPNQSLYALQLRSPQISAGIPIRINLWNRAQAIQTPSSIQLNVIKTPNGKAVDRAAIPITNVGAGNIYNLRASLTQSDVYGNTKDTKTISGVSLKIENQSNSQLFGNTNVLQPGQTLLPPMAIIAESTKEESGDYQKTLTITGIIDGRRTVLRQIPVYIRTGNTSCLKASAFDTPLFFVSSELSGTISKKITLRNECLEPVRITAVTPQTIAANPLSIAPLEGELILEKDEERGFQILLTKEAPSKAQFSMTVNGIMVLSQKEVETNPLSVEVAIGQEELSFAHSTNTVKVNICEGGKMDIHFPVLAEKDECSNAYCDAEQASNMLSKIIEKQVSKAVSIMQSKQNDTAQFENCDLKKDYCTFEQLGVKSIPFELFFQHDSLTPEILQTVMRNGKYPRLARMQTEIMTPLSGEDAEEAFKTRIGTGLGNKVFIPFIQGCGKYQLAIVGSVENVANRLQPGSINVAVTFVTGRQKTAECQDKIINAANFLPKDGSLTLDNTQNTLLGVVTSSSQWETQAKWLAETLFGTEKRATLTSGSNRLDLQIGNLSQSVLELTLDPNTFGDNPKRIITTIKQTQGSTQEAAIKEAGQIISSLGKKVEGCITSDQQTWRISALKDVGAYEFEGCRLTNDNGFLNVRSALSCCSMKAKSETQSEVSFNIDPNGDYALPGLQELNLYEESNTKEKIPGNKIVNDAKYLLEFNSEAQAFEKEVLLCAQTNAKIQQQANKATFQLSSTREQDDTKAGPYTFEINTCSFEPSDLIAKALKKGNGVWYGTVDWEDDVQKKYIRQVVNEIVNGDKIGEGYIVNQDQGIFANNNPLYSEGFVEKQSNAMKGYGVACVAACGTCSLLMPGVGWVAGAIDCGLGCGIPLVVGQYGVHNQELQTKFEGTALEGTIEITNKVYTLPEWAGEAGISTVTNVQPGEEPAATAFAAGTIGAGYRGYKPGSAAVKADKKKAEDAVKKAAEATDAVESAAEIERTTVAAPQDATRVNLRELGVDMELNSKVDDAVAELKVQQTKWNKLVNKSEVVHDFKLSPQMNRTIQVFNEQLELIEDSLQQNIGRLEGIADTHNTKMFSDSIDSLKGELERVRAYKEEIPDIVKSGKKMWAKKAVGSRLKNLGENVDIIIRHAEETAENLRVSPATGTKAAVKVADEASDIPVAGAKKLRAASKGFAKGLVCGAVGNVAGYTAYRMTLLDEIDNKITLQADSTNMLDPQTNELVFLKGQTYKIVIKSDSQTKNGKQLSIDIVSPAEMVNPSAWIECDDA
jgi:hypothetical protein